MGVVVNRKRVWVVVIVLIVTCLCTACGSKKAGNEQVTENSPVKPAETVSSADVQQPVDLATIYAKINQTGLTEETLSSLTQAEKQLFPKGAGNSLEDVNKCYNAYLNNLMTLNKQGEAAPIVQRWDKALQAVYEAKQDLSIEFSQELLQDSDNLFYTCLTLGPQYDPVLLNHSQNLADFFEKRVKQDPALPRGYYQSALESLSYALLYNKKYDQYNTTVDKTLSVEDQTTGKLPEDTMPILAYKYLLAGNNPKSEETLGNFRKIFGDTLFNQVNPPRTGTNLVIDDLYQIKKRNIAVDNVDKIRQTLPEAVVVVTAVSVTGSAGKNGVQQGDVINKYSGVKCFSYYQLMDLIEQNKNNSNIALEVIRGKQSVPLKVPSGRLGIGVEERVNPL